MLFAFLPFFLFCEKDRDRGRTRKKRGKEGERERRYRTRVSRHESPAIGRGWMPYSLNHSQLGHIERGKCKRAIIVHSERNPSLDIFFCSSLCTFFSPVSRSPYSRLRWRVYTFEKRCLLDLRRIRP